MIKEVKLASLLLIAGTLLIASHYIDLSPLNTAVGKSKAATKNINFEIFDCVVQGNGTYEKSGRCPDSSSEAVSYKTAASEKILPNAKLAQSEEPKAETNTSRSTADDTKTMPKESKQPEPKISAVTSTADDRKTMPEESKQPELDAGQNNNFINDTSVKPNTKNEEKYDFDQIHIVGRETSIENTENSQPNTEPPLENTEKSQPNIEPPIEVLTSQDPFGPSVR